MGEADGVLVIEAEAIPDYLTGALVVERGEVVVRCDGVDVCRFAGGVLVDLACDHPAHGCHPRLRDKYARLHELLAKLKTVCFVETGPCPKCPGDGWLPADSDEARRVTLLSLMVGMWRGVPFKPRGLQAMMGGVTMDAILMGHKPSGGSSSTPGQEGCS